MAGNTFGTLFKITTFGESHGPALGVVIDGCPPKLKVDEDLIRTELAHRKPGQSKLTTTRNEDEQFEILSGVFEGFTTGAPIAITVRNQDQRSSDYDALKDIYRPSHADYTWEAKYGIRDHRGSGRASARETVGRVLGGAFAKMLLKESGISIHAFVSRVGKIALQKNYTELDLNQTENNAVRCPDDDTAKAMMALIEETKKAGDTVGGSIGCVVQHVPAGLGEPVFDKLHALIGQAVLSINACKGIEFGSGFEGTKNKGSEENDVFTTDVSGNIITRTNRSGGIQGGLSNGQSIYFTSAFKPVSTIHLPQETINRNKESVDLTIAGRHDPCVLPRAVVIVEAMTALVLADLLLRQRALGLI